MEELLDAIDRFLSVPNRQLLERRLDDLETRLESDMAAAFRQQGTAFQAGFDEEDWETDWGSALDGAAAATVGAFADPIVSAAGQAMVRGAEDAAAELDIEIDFKLDNPRAVEYLRQHGAEQVSKINDTTRSRLRTLIADGVEQHLSYDQIARQIIAEYNEFAVGRPQQHIDSRAHLIATTEIGNAYSFGNMFVAQQLKQSGLRMEKKWLTVHDGKVCSELCAANEQQEWIPVDDEFQSGHQHPLAHPACRCSCLYRRVAVAAGAS